MRDRAYRRKQRLKHIKRKENILRRYRLDNPPHKYNDSDIFGSIVFPRGREYSHEGSWLPYWIVADRGRLDKGKIHCSCGLCRTKTRCRKNYGKVLYYKPSDLRKIQKMEDAKKELFDF